MLFKSIKWAGCALITLSLSSISTSGAVKTTTSPELLAMKIDRVTPFKTNPDWKIDGYQVQMGKDGVGMLYKKDQVKLDCKQDAVVFKTDRDLWAKQEGGQDKWVPLADALKGKPEPKKEIPDWMKRNQERGVKLSHLEGKMRADMRREALLNRQKKKNKKGGSEGQGGQTVVVKDRSPGYTDEGAKGVRALFEKAERRKRDGKKGESKPKWVRGVSDQDARNPRDFFEREEKRLERRREFLKKKTRQSPGYTDKQAEGVRDLFKNAGKRRLVEGEEKKKLKETRVSLSGLKKGNVVMVIGVEKGVNPNDQEGVKKMTRKDFVKTTREGKTGNDGEMKKKGGMAAWKISLIVIGVLASLVLMGVLVKMCVGRGKESDNGDSYQRDSEDGIQQL